MTVLIQPTLSSLTCENVSVAHCCILVYCHSCTLCSHIRAYLYQKDLYHPCWKLYTLQYSSVHRQEHREVPECYLICVNSDGLFVTTVSFLFNSLSACVAGLKCLPLLVVLSCVWCPTKILLHQSAPWRKYKTFLFWHRQSTQQFWNSFCWSELDLMAGAADSCRSHVQADNECRQMSSASEQKAGTQNREFPF